MLDILIDADMFLDALLNRVGGTDDPVDIWEITKFNSIQGYVTDIGFDRILRIIERIKGVNEAEVVALSLEARVRVYEATRAQLHEARGIHTEYESAIEIVCAREKPFGAIITTSPHCFECAGVTTLSIEELMARRSLEDLANHRDVCVLSGDGFSLSQMDKKLESDYIQKIESIRSLVSVHQEISLIGRDMSYENFRKADFSFARLASTKLIQAHLSHSKFYKANLYEADLSGADLEGADLTRASLVSAVLDTANLQYLKAIESDFRYARLRSANLKSSNLSRSNFRRADLSGAVLKHAFLNDSNLSKSVLDNACLVGASLFYADLRNANLRNANLQAANLSCADLRGADLTGACLDGCRLAETDLRGAILHGIDFKKVDLAKAKRAPVPLTLRQN